MSVQQILKFKEEKENQLGIQTDTHEKEKIQNEHNAREEKNKVNPIKVCKKLKFDKRDDSEDETFCLICNGPYS